MTELEEAAKEGIELIYLYDNTYRYTTIVDDKPFTIDYRLAPIPTIVI